MSTIEKKEILRSSVHCAQFLIIERAREINRRALGRNCSTWRSLLPNGRRSPLWNRKTFHSFASLRKSKLDGWRILILLKISSVIWRWCCGLRNNPVAHYWKVYEVVPTRIRNGADLAFWPRQKLKGDKIYRTLCNWKQKKNCPDGLVSRIPGKSTRSLKMTTFR